jgi:dephospho-CoA kinase
MSAPLRSELKKISIGLTGGIGCGKTAVADMFAARGASVIDTDQISHTLTASHGAAIPEICTQFGLEFLDAAGALDRIKMRACVFGHPEARVRLESILHPLILIEAERLAKQALGNYVIFVVPLLIESVTWKQRVSRILVVDCPETLQIQRVTERNGMTEQQVRAIMDVQVSREIRLAAAQDIILNDQNLASLEAEVAKFHAFYSALAMGK